MTKQMAILEGPAGPTAAYACPMCGGRIEGSCPCGRARTGWLYSEEVIVIPAPRANGSGGPRE
jgi:hypothetical protein